MCKSPETFLVILKLTLLIIRIIKLDSPGDMPGGVLSVEEWMVILALCHKVFSENRKLNIHLYNISQI